MKQTDAVRAAASGAALLVLSACSSVEPVDPYSVRLAAYQGWARLGSGSASATDPREQALGVRGNQMDVDRDLALSASPGQRASIEGRLAEDAEVRLSFERFHDFEGHQRMDRTRRFDGTTYVPGTFVNTDLDSNRTVFTYAHRVAAIRGDGLPADVALVAGVERDQSVAKVTGFPPPGRDRFQVAGAPIGGLEARLGLAPGIVLTAGVTGGGVQHGDKRLIIGDAGVGLRWNVLGPIDLMARYEFSTRHQVTQRGNDERSDLRVNENVFLLGVGLHF